MTNIIDIRDRLRSDDDTVEIYVCDCGCGMWRLYVDGRTECINCAGMPSALKCYVESTDEAG
jgi:hypothetical protein